MRQEEIEVKDRKREERRQRSAEAKEAQERQRRQRVLGRRVLVAIGVLAIAGLVVFTVRREPPSRGGQVWSPEHGHWHDQ